VLTPCHQKQENDNKNTVHNSLNNVENINIGGNERGNSVLSSQGRSNLRMFAVTQLRIFSFPFSIKKYKD